MLFSASFRIYIYIDIRMILTVFYDNHFTKYSTCISIILKKRNNLENVAFLCVNTEFSFSKKRKKRMNTYLLINVLFVIYILFSIHLQSNWIHHLNKHTAHDKMCDLYIYTVMYYESLLSLFDIVIIPIHVFFKTIS